MERITRAEAPHMRGDRPYKFCGVYCSVQLKCQIHLLYRIGISNENVVHSNCKILRRAGMLKHGPLSIPNATQRQTLRVVRVALADLSDGPVLAEDVVHLLIGDLVR